MLLDGQSNVSFSDKITFVIKVEDGALVVRPAGVNRSDGQMRECNKLAAAVATIRGTHLASVRTLILGGEGGRQGDRIKKLCGQ